MRHRRGSDLAGREALGGQFVAGHQPDGVRQRRWSGAELHQCRDGVVVQRSRIHLADAVQDRGETKVLGDPTFEVAQALLVAAEQIQHVLAGPHRTLDAAQRIAGDEFPNALQCNQCFLGRRCEPLTQGGGLGGDIVTAPGHHQIPVVDCPLGQSGRNRHSTVVSELQGLPDLQLLDVLGQIPARHPLVHVFVARQGIELLDSGFDVVAGHPLPGCDRLEVHLLCRALVVDDRGLGDVHAEFALRSQHRHPESALGDNLGRR